MNVTLYYLSPNVIFLLKSLFPTSILDTGLDLFKLEWIHIFFLSVSLPDADTSTTPPPPLSLHISKGGLNDLNAPSRGQFKTPPMCVNNLFFIGVYSKLKCKNVLPFF